MLFGRFRRRAVRRAAVLSLLFALVVRAAIPAGFMLALDASGRPGLVLCSGVGPMLPGGGAGASVHQHHHHHIATGDAPGFDEDGAGQSRSSHEAGSLCPFAASAGPAPPPALPALEFAGCSLLAFLPARPVSEVVSTILRVQQARGPPVVV